MIRNAIMKSNIAAIPGGVRGLACGSGGRMAGKVALVTASTAGIGLAIAKKLGQGCSPPPTTRGHCHFSFESLLPCHHAPLLPTPWVCRGLRLDYLSCLGPSLVGSEFDVSLKVIFPHSLRFDHLLMQRAPRS